MSPPSTARLETLADATSYLDGLINRERRAGFRYERLDLRPIRALLDPLGRPEQSLSVLHVAGSKGKGSVCLFAESILLELGESVGTFTSPHLESWVERFRIDGRPVEEARLVEAVERVRPHVEKLRAGSRETLPSFFDATTAVAFLLFAEAGVDHALVEVGLGGRLDSTNVVSPRVSCITSIELEHSDKLGDTEAEIALEKAGILKPETIAVLGALGAEADRVIRDRATALAAPVRALGEAFRVESRHDRSREPASGLEANSFRYVEREGFSIEVDLLMPGEPARSNAAIAIACVRALNAHCAEALRDAARRALGSVRLPGRIEVLAADPAVVIDSAHTARSACALAIALEALAPKGFDLLLSVSSDKDLAAVLDPLLPKAHRVWTTRADPIRSLDAQTLAGRILDRAPALEVCAVEDPVEAVHRARAALSEGLVLCTTGSVYLAGLARRILGSGELGGSGCAVDPVTTDT